MRQNRRNFLKSAAAVTGSAMFMTNPTALPGTPAGNTVPQAVGQAAYLYMKYERKPVEVFINSYTVGTFYAREGIDVNQNLDQCFAELKAAGLAGFEASAGQPGELDRVIDAMAKQDLKLRSIYAGANLHDAGTDAAEIKRVIAVAERAKSAGTKFVVFNPAAKGGKSDAELIRQNKNLDLLGAALREMGMNLSMHYHTSELEFAAREFHSFMCDTDPANVSLCMEVHWSYRASGNSAVSVYNHAKLYADRVSTMHLRQSQGGTWTETFVAKADIDCEKVLAILQANKGFDSNCHIVLEQAPENGTPKTLKPLEIFKQSAEAVKKMYEG